MFKKIIMIIIGLIAILLISFALIHQVSSADILKTCKISDTNKYLSEDGDGKKELLKNLRESGGGSRHLKIRVAFEKAREKYHDTIRCVFDEATMQMLGSAGADTGNIGKAHAANLTNMFGGLMTPSKACLPDKKLKEIIESNSPATLLGPILETYNNYSAFIRSVIVFLHDYPPANMDYAAIVASYESLKIIMENEAQDSMLALDAAFQGLKELRMSFVMHVHFQCMLNNLESYRRMLSNLRGIVSTLPKVIENASMHK